MKKVEHISVAIEKVLSRIKGVYDGIREVRKVWNEAVGEEIAMHAFPVQISKGCLLVRVDSPVWFHQLSFLKDKMKKKINGAAGHSIIKEIHLRVKEQ